MKPKRKQHAPNSHTNVCSHASKQDQAVAEFDRLWETANDQHKTSDPPQRERAGIARKCMHLARMFIDARIACGMPARLIAQEAARHFATEFAAEGLHSDRTPETMQAFAVAVSKHCYASLHAGRNRSGMSRTVAKLAEDSDARNALLGLYVGHPECRLLLIQSIIERNIGKDDSTALRAIVAAHDMCPAPPLPPDFGRPIYHSFELTTRYEITPEECTDEKAKN